MPKIMENVTVKNIPAAALRFSAGPCQFVASEPNAEKVPVSIKARTGKAIDHWYFGKIVHDLAGMKLNKPILPIDYCHDWNQVLGFLDTFNRDSGDLQVSGALTPFKPDDKANEVIHKNRSGVPYEASIDCTGPMRIEEIQLGSSAQVNGYSVDGPALIIREWPLRGVAICPYGADPNTVTQLTAGDTVPVEYFIKNKESQMTVEKLSTNPPESSADTRIELKRFMEAFGQAGVTWFTEGKSFEDCTQLHLKSLGESLTKQTEQIQQLTAERDKLTAQTTTLTSEKDTMIKQFTQLQGELTRYKAAVDRGEKDPVSFMPETEPGQGGSVDTKLAQNLGSNLAKFAAGIKLPK